MSRRAALVIALFIAFVVGLAVASERSSAAMAKAATHFLSGLTPEQRQRASFPFDSDERLRFHYIPNEQFPRKGLMIKEMTEPQRNLARELLKSGLSQHGYLTATTIIDLETILRALEDGRLARDPELYYFSIFGTPGPRDAWGWRVNGHHVALNFTIVNGAMVASSPAFFGANPAEVKEGPKKGLRILGAEEDAARALLKSFDAPQRQQATIAETALNEIVTTNNVKVDPLSPSGITAASMTPPQRELLNKLIDAYTSLMTEDVAAERMARLRKAGLERIGFAWAGGAERGQKHYYRIQGPTFLVEYDNTQNDANHIHSIWRDFEGDFGRDLLREHIKSTPH